MTHEATETRLASSLAVGDRFNYRGVDIEVLRDQEPWSERFGRDGFIRYWCKRLDTDQEGYLHFGPGGVLA